MLWRKDAKESPFMKRNSLLLQETGSEKEKGRIIASANPRAHLKFLGGIMNHNGNNIEARLWEAADELRSNSKLKSSEYSVPVLGLALLRYVDHICRRRRGFRR